MPAFDEIDLIEQYLEGTLPLAEKQALEARLATDADFRQKVELHRQMQVALEDPQKLQLRDMMAEIVQQPALEPTSNKWLKGFGIVVLILLSIAAWWYWSASSPGKALPAPPPQQTAPTQTLPSEDKTAPGAEEQIDKPRPIAMAKGRNFTPNPDFESRMGGSMIRSSAGESVSIQMPTPATDFKIVQGLARLQFKGSVPADDDLSEQPIAITIFSNKPNSAPVARILPAISTPNSGTWTFSVKHEAKLSPGQYYFVLERVQTEDLLWVGKFTVGE